ncbi:hypothetical protein EYF80_060283 [Liparis tanakae]|uniref:Uncharacterized protein n=1 Tax=Liparis tanakae TaxID=230148 RepID=A0A4Z2ELC8_9TELE|nr:hypothetical protein EYF80_060283 [Liparis tanakae]
MFIPQLRPIGLMASRLYGPGNLRQEDLNRFNQWIRSPAIHASTPPRPQPNRLAGVLFQHPQQQLPQTPRSCKLVQGRPHWRGKMARERERERERGREREQVAVHFLSTFRTCGRNMTWLQEEEVCVSLPADHRQLTVR